MSVAGEPGSGDLPLCLSLFSPGCQNRWHPIGDLLPGQKAIHTRSQQPIILGV